MQGFRAGKVSGVRDFHSEGGKQEVLRTQEPAPVISLDKNSKVCAKAIERELTTKEKEDLVGWWLECERQRGPGG